MSTPETRYARSGDVNIAYQVIGGGRLDLILALGFATHVTLLGIAPPIWRTIQVPESYSFWDLHVALQDSMGWLDYLLHLFRLGKPVTKEVVQIRDDDMTEDCQ